MEQKHVGKIERQLKGKLPMKRTLISLLFVISPVFGQWQLIDDFEQWESPTFIDDASDIGWISHSISGADEYWMLKDPQQHGNICLYLEPGDYGVSAGRVWVVKGLPDEGIAPNETGTLFVRFLREGIHNSWYWGTADSRIVEGEDGIESGPFAYSEFNALCHPDREDIFQFRDRDAYIKSNPELKVESHAWYKFWMVVRNTFTEGVSTGTHTIYAQGPDDPEPFPVTIGEEPVKSEAFFRRAPIGEDGTPQSIIWTMLATDNTRTEHYSSGGGLFLLDDFYFSKGQNLTDPTSTGSWPIPVDPGSGDVDTGGWMGWINAAEAPYLFVYSLPGWIYMEDFPTEAQGAWGYFYK